MRESFSKFRKALEVTAGIITAATNVGCEQVKTHEAKPIAAASTSVKSKIDKVYDAGVSGIEQTLYPAKIPPTEQKEDEVISAPSIVQLTNNNFRNEVEQYKGKVLVGFTNDRFYSSVGKDDERLKSLEGKIATKYKIKVGHCNFAVCYYPFRKYLSGGERLNDPVVVLFEDGRPIDHIEDFLEICNTDGQTEKMIDTMLKRNSRRNYKGEYN